MKTTGLVIISILLLGLLGMSPASAQSPGVGYIPLLQPGYDTALPREVLSQQNYDRIALKLLQAQSQGVISGYEPDTYGGFVRVIFAPGSSRMVNGLDVRSDLKDVLVPPTSAEMNTGRQADDTYIGFQVNSSCFYVSNLVTGTEVTAMLKTPGGETTGAAYGLADSSGYFWGCFGGPMPSVIPGYKVVVTRQFRTEAPVTYQTVVPAANFKSVTKSTATVTGKAPANLEFALDWIHWSLTATNNPRMLRIVGKVPANGSWSASYATEYPGSGAFRGGDTLTLILRKNENFNFNFGMRVPYLICQLRSPVCAYRGIPKQAVTVTILHAGTLHTFSGKVSSQGEFGVILEDTRGNPILLKAGDVVTGTNALKLTLPTLTSAVNRTTDRITGKAPINNYFEVGFTMLSSGTTNQVWIKTDPLGNYTADFSAIGGIPSAVPLITHVIYTPKSSGNVTIFEKIVP